MQPSAADPILHLGEYHLEIRRFETGPVKNLGERGLAPKQSCPANARQCDLADFERRVGCAQDDLMSDQAIGAHRVFQFADPQR